MPNVSVNNTQVYGSRWLYILLSYARLWQSNSSHPWFHCAVANSSSQLWVDKYAPRSELELAVHKKKVMWFSIRSDRPMTFAEPHVSGMQENRLSTLLSISSLSNSQSASAGRFVIRHKENQQPELAVSGFMLIVVHTIVIFSRSRRCGIGLNHRFWRQTRWAG